MKLPNITLVVLALTASAYGARIEESRYEDSCHPEEGGLLKSYDLTVDFAQTGPNSTKLKDVAATLERKLELEGMTYVSDADNYTFEVTFKNLKNEVQTEVFMHSLEQLINFRHVKVTLQDVAMPSYLASVPEDMLAQFKKQYDKVEDQRDGQEIRQAQRQSRIDHRRAEFEESNGLSIGMDDTYFSSDGEED